MLPYWQQLQPFSDLIHGRAAGPQNDEQDESEHLFVLIPSLDSSKNSVWLRIQSDGCCGFTDQDDSLFLIDFSRLIDYLRQVPRPIYSFSKNVSSH